MYMYKPANEEVLKIYHPRAENSKLAGLYMYMYMYNAYRPLNHDKDVYYTYVVWSHLGM